MTTCPVLDQQINERRRIRMKVYVGNLPFSVTDKDLNEMFVQFGQITEAVLIKDKFSGRSKGFGFVTFADKASGEKAIADMNGKDMQGRALTVNEARPMEPRADRGGGDRGSGGGGGGFRRNRY